MNNKFENCVMICQNCGHETVIDPNKTIGAITSLEFCPWCGKEIKEAEDDSKERRGLFGSDRRPGHPEGRQATGVGN